MCLNLFKIYLNNFYQNNKKGATERPKSKPDIKKTNPTTKPSIKAKAGATIKPIIKEKVTPNIKTAEKQNAEQNAENAKIAKQKNEQEENKENEKATQILNSINTQKSYKILTQGEYKTCRRFFVFGH